MNPTFPPLAVPPPTFSRLSLSPGATRLDDWGVIRAHGADAASFLQGQLTQDVSGLEAGRWRLAGHCSPKGRLLASFVVWRGGADEILLACSRDLLEATLKRLRMFVLRARCVLEDAGDALAVWGVVRPHSEAAGSVAARPSGWTLALAGVAGCARELHVAPASAAPPCDAELPLAAWQWLEVMGGVPRIVARTADAFVPQMVNFEAVDGVNFRKGCYPGQEVVARSQYRGTLKRRMMLARSDEDATVAAQPGDAIYAPSDPDQPAGQVVLAAHWPPAGEWARAMQVELKLALADEAAPPRLGAVDGPPLRLAAPPYALDAAEA